MTALTGQTSSPDAGGTFLSPGEALIRAERLRSEGRLVEAAEQFRRSVEIYSDVRAWSSLGEIYDRENEPEQAHAAWEQVLAFESFNPHAHRSLGQIYLSHEQWALAQKEFQMCLLMDQKDSVALAGLEKIRSATGAADNKK